MMISLMVVPSRITAALANRIREEEEREGVVQEVMQIFHIFYIFNLFPIPGAADGQDRARLPDGEGVRGFLQRELEPREDGAGQAIYYYIIICVIYLSYL